MKLANHKKTSTVRFHLSKILRAVKIIKTESIMVVTREREKEGRGVTVEQVWSLLYKTESHRTMVAMAAQQCECM